MENTNQDAILEIHRKKGNTREIAILELLREGKKHGENAITLNAVLRGLGDKELFALYITVFDRAVGEEAVRS